MPILPRNPAAPFRPFVLQSVAVSGSTLPAAELASVYRPYLGRTMDNRTLAAMTTALGAVYEKSDVALYTILVPEQGFAGGTVRLLAIEGYVAKVEIQGKLRRSRLRLLEDYVKRIARERPLHVSTLQRVLSFVRDMPGVTATPRFELGQAQGAVTLVLPVSEKPVQVSVGANDRGTAFLGRTQFEADVQFNGVLSGGDQLRTTVVLPAKARRFQYYAGAYTTPLDDDGTALTGTLSTLRTRPAILPLRGDATSFGLQLSHPLLRRYDRSFTATVGVDGIDSHNALFGFTLSNDRVRALRLGVSYAIAGKRNQLTLSATTSFGLDVLGARVTPGASSRTFRKLDARIADSLEVGRAFVLRLDGFGQATGDDLPSSEQIVLGGDTFGRAYEAGSIAGDSGYAGSAEFAWVPPTGLPPRLAGSELYLYSDAGHVSYRGRLGDPAVSAHLASVGGGVRLHLAGRTVVQLEAVRGLADPTGDANRQKARVLFSIRSAL